MARRRGNRPKRFEHVRAKLLRERRGQRDVYAPLSRLRLDLGEPTAPTHLRFRATVEADGKRLPATLRPTALRQLAAHAGVPAAFMDRVPPALGLRTLRSLLDIAAGDDDPTHLIRLREPRRRGEPYAVRAVLPASFARVPDVDLLADFDATLGESAGRDVVVTHVEIDEDLFSLRAVFADETRDLGTARHPDRHTPGLHLRSSETGVGPLQVRCLLYREVCANGMTALAGSQSQLRRRMTRFDRVEFRNAVGEAARESIDVSRRLLGRLDAAREATLDDPRVEIERVFRTYKLGSPRGRRAQWVAGELLRHVSLFGLRRFDLVQAFTAVARGLEHDRRLQWEDAMAAYVMSDASVERRNGDA